MGVDINGVIASRDGAVREKFDFFRRYGRNSNWFEDMQGRGSDWEYEYLNFDYPTLDTENLPEKIREALEQEWGYNFRSIKVSDYIEWFEKYRPDRVASYFSEYEIWKMTKGWAPDEWDILITPDEIHNTLKEFVNPYNSAAALYQAIVKEDSGVEADDIIYYYFDC